jgi:hypothetical protein
MRAGVGLSSRKKLPFSHNRHIFEHWTNGATIGIWRLRSSFGNHLIQAARVDVKKTNPIWRPLVVVLAAILGHGISTVSAVRAQTPSASSVAMESSPALADNAVVSSPVKLDNPTAFARPRAAGTSPVETPPNEHPLAPVLRWAKEGLPAIEALNDYSATLVRRERVRGKLSGYEYLAIKIRHHPFSVYALFQAPASVKGQEVIYIAGQNEGNMWAHKARMAVTMSIHPEGIVAMSGRNYPLTEIGLVNLVRRLAEVGQEDVNYDGCEVKYFTQAKVSQRPCTVIQVVHPARRDVFRFHLARVFVDDELKVPIRYEAYDWPREPGGQPELLEEYTYLDLKLNNGFTDEEFSTQNPEYHFERAMAELDRRAEAR